MFIRSLSKSHLPYYSRGNSTLPLTTETEMCTLFLFYLWIILCKWPCSPGQRRLLTCQPFWPMRNFHTPVVLFSICFYLYCRDNLACLLISKLDLACLIWVFKSVLCIVLQETCVQSSCYAAVEIHLARHSCSSNLWILFFAQFFTSGSMLILEMILGYIYLAVRDRLLVCNHGRPWLFGGPVRKNNGGPH